MAKSLTIQFLELLETPGIAGSANISPFMVSRFKALDATLIKNEGVEEDSSYTFIKSLRDKKAVIIDHSFLPNDLFTISESEKDYFWFDSMEVQASITVEGVDYLNQLRLTNATIDSSRWTKRNVWVTGILSALTAILSGAGAFTALKTFEETKTNSVQLNKIEIRLDSLSLQSLRIEQRLSRLPNPKASQKK